jgi:hypothetical protein
LKKPFLIALGLTAIAACGGKVVVDAGTSSGAGGAGGTASTVSTADGQDPTTDVATSVVSVGPSSSVTTGTGMSCDPNYTCAEALTGSDGDPSKLCDGTLAAKLYDVLVQCICADVCAIECGNNACAGDEASTPCKTCIGDPAQGCGNQFNDCANNL